VCNVRGRSETTNKSDRIDADGLSEQLRLGALKSVYHGSPGVATLKELVRCYTNLVDDSTRVMLRVKAIFRGRAIGTPIEAGVPALAASGLAGQARGAGSADASGLAAGAARRSAGAANEGQSGDNAIRPGQLGDARCRVTRTDSGDPRMRAAGRLTHSCVPRTHSAHRRTHECMPRTHECVRLRIHV